MIPQVTEGQVERVRRTGRHAQGRPDGGRRRGARSARWLLAALMCGAAYGQADEQSDQPFEVTVRDMAEGRHQVRVPLNRSVLVETSIETARADVIADNIVDVQPISPTQLLLTGKSFGTTQVILWGETDKRSMLEVTVELDVKALEDALQDVDPQGDIRVKPVLGNIVLIGTVSSAEAAARAMDIANMFLPYQSLDEGAAGVRNHLQVAGEQQVLLRCVVAEVSRSATRRLGINGFLAGDNFRDAFVINQLGGINPIDIGVAAGVPVNQTVPFQTGRLGVPLATAPTLSLGFPRVQMQLFIKAMSDNSLLKILAEPNLTCISGETASFLAGGEFPIPVPQDNRNITIEFREFGVRLNFTPVVSAHQRIRLRVRPEVSETDFSTAVQIEGFAVPGLTNRSAETTVEVGAGQTLAMAGLLSEEVKAFASRIPGIGDLPVLGSLFRSVEYKRDMTELVILVTPEIVAPMDPQQVSPAPGRLMSAPSDFDLYALGMLEGPPRRAGAGPGGRERVDGAAAGADPNDLTIRGPWGYAGSGDAD